MTAVWCSLLLRSSLSIHIQRATLHLNQDRYNDYLLSAGVELPLPTYLARLSKCDEPTIYLYSLRHYRVT